MSDFDIYLGECVCNHVDWMRGENGKWSVQRDVHIAEGANHHVRSQSCCVLEHADPAWIPGQIECVYRALTHDPEGAAYDFVFNADDEHRWRFLHEGINGQGVAVEAIILGFRPLYRVSIVWRGRLM